VKINKADENSYLALKDYQLSRRYVQTQKKCGMITTSSNKRGLLASAGCNTEHKVAVYIDRGSLYSA
jgi:hypothetical protein